MMNAEERLRLLAKLQPAEKRTLALAAEGWEGREIARALYLAENTVKARLTLIYAKLGVKNRTQAALIWHNIPFYRAEDVQ